MVSPATPWVPFSRLTSPVTTRPVAIPVWKVRRVPTFSTQPGSEHIDTLVDPACRLESPDVVILVGLGDAEEGNDGIADILLDKTVIKGDDPGDLAEDPARDLLDLLGVEPLRQGRVA